MFDNGNKYHTPDPDPTAPQPCTSAGNGGDWNRKRENDSRKRLPRQPHSHPRSWWQRSFGNTGTRMVVSIVLY